MFGIAAGISEGLGLGYNSLALLCTRAVAEMNYLAKALGSTETTLAGEEEDDETNDEATSMAAAVTSLHQLRPLSASPARSSPPVRPVIHR